ncbi:MAG: InlB B-repeat-containing protein, partial [Candidatus Hadarchaeota archaeon]
NYYNYGEEVVDWVEGYSSGGPNGGQEEKGEDNLYLYAQKEVGNNGERTWVTEERVDLTDIENLWIEWQNTGSTNTKNKSYFVVSDNKEGDHDDYVERIENDGDFGIENSRLDVTELNDEYYLRIHAYSSGGNHESEISTFRVWGERESAPFFEVNILETNSPVNEGENLDVTAEITNNGEVSDTQNIVLSDVDDGDLDTYEDLSLESGESQKVTLTWETGVGDAGDTLEVASEDDEDNIDVSVYDEDEPFFEVEITDPSDSESFEVGDEVVVDYTVNNTGGEFDNQDVVFSVDGVEEDREENISLDEDEEFDGEFTWTAGDTGDYTLEVASDDHADTVEISVLEEVTYYDLNISASSGGYTDPLMGTHTYREGEEVTIEAISDEGWGFENWTGDVTSEDKEITLTMDSNKSIRANFVELHDLTVETVGEGEVTVSLEDENVAVTDENTLTGIEDGTEVGLVAEADGGWVFHKWTGDLESGNTEENISMDGDKEVVARFAREELELQSRPGSVEVIASNMQYVDQRHVYEGGHLILIQDGRGLILESSDVFELNGGENRISIGYPRISGRNRSISSSRDESIDVTYEDRVENFWHVSENFRIEIETKYAGVWEDDYLVGVREDIAEEFDVEEVEVGSDDQIVWLEVNGIGDFITFEITEKVVRVS